MSPRKTLFLLAGLISAAAAAHAQQNPLLPEDASQRVSEHVYAIIGFPNIAIVTGTKATLVVDTGMGQRNGATVAREVQKVAKGPGLYLTTTHFHPEHVSGEQGFPGNTLLIRNTVQQEELDQGGMQMVKQFSGFSAVNKELLEGVQFRKPDILFDHEVRIDLGGVTARLFWLGPAHTKGDEIIYVEEDGTLIPGDIVQDKLVPSFYGDNSSAKSWIAILDQLAPLKPRYIVPDHGGLGDGSLIAKERAFLVDMRDLTLAQKRQGKPAEEAATIVTNALKVKYPEWPLKNPLTNAVKRIYAEE